MSGSNDLAISLDELERLIRLLGMLGSSADGEVLAAARHAVRWVAEKRTDWRTLLTPPADANPVTGVVAVPDPEAREANRLRDRTQAFDLGYQEGLKQGLAKAMAQVKAQAHAVHAGFVQPAGSAWAAPGAFSANPARNPAQGPVRASAAPSGGYPAGSWQAVCQELLDRHAQGIPGVLRSREEQFVTDVLRRGFPTLTPAQEHWLRDIAGRAGLSW